MNDFKVECAILCDDIRREISGKDILIGVYGSSLSLLSFPSQIILCYWIEASAKKPGDLSIEFEIKVNGEQIPLYLRIESKINDAAEHFALITPQIPLLIKQPGSIEFSARVPGQKKWRLVKLTPIKLGVFPVVMPVKETDQTHAPSS